MSRLRGTGVPGPVGLSPLLPQQDPSGEDFFPSWEISARGSTLPGLYELVDSMKHYDKSSYIK